MKLSRLSIFSVALLILATSCRESIQDDSDGWAAEETSLVTPADYRAIVRSMYLEGRNIAETVDIFLEVQADPKNNETEKLLADARASFSSVKISEIESQLQALGCPSHLSGTHKATEDLHGCLEDLGSYLDDPTRIDTNGFQRSMVRFIAAYDRLDSALPK